MKLYGFSFEKNTIETYQELIPPSQNKIVFRDFLFNRYSLPELLDSLKEQPKEVEIYPLRMNENEINKIDFFISIANTKGVTVSRSAIVRDIYKKIIEHYRLNPLPLREIKKSAFRIPYGTKLRLANYINEGQRSYEISNFLVNSYIPSNEFVNPRKQVLETLDFVAEPEIYELLDQYAEEYNFSRGRSRIFRDALVQFEKQLEEHSPKKGMLEEKLYQALTDYRKIASREAIITKIHEFLNQIEKSPTS